MSVDSLIPGTVLQAGTPWLAATRGLPEPRLSQEYDRPALQREGRIARVVNALSRP